LFLLADCCGEPLSSLRHFAWDGTLEELIEENQIMKILTEDELAAISGGMKLQCLTYLIASGSVVAVAALSTGPSAIVIAPALAGWLLAKSPC